MPCEIPDSFSDCEAAIADDTFASSNRKAIRNRAARRGPQTPCGCTRQVVGPQATDDIPSWADTIGTKRRSNFQEVPAVHAKSYDPSYPLSFLKTFIADKPVENIVNFTNK